MANYDEWKEAFDNHTERATICDESKTTVGKVNDTSCIVMLYDVDMQGMQQLMGSEFMITLSKEMRLSMKKCTLFRLFNHKLKEGRKTKD